MSKICSNTNCKKEIPTTATYCPYCGMQQVAEEELSEEEKLRRRIKELEDQVAEQQKTIQFLIQHCSDNGGMSNIQINNITSEKENAEKKEVLYSTLTPIQSQTTKISNNSDDFTNSLFSVGTRNKVLISKGNLQYQASSGIWRFAEHQYDYIGTGNSKISQYYDGWIDLFGFGTSGWPRDGANAYMPYHKSEHLKDYYIGDGSANSLTDKMEKADWGKYNSIDGGAIGEWRTPNAEEWQYLLFQRNIEISWRMVDICGIIGLVLFPDSCNPSRILGHFKDSEFIKIEKYEWAKWEAEGCIFLPQAGNRTGSKYNSESGGNYWLSSNYDGFAQRLYFNGKDVVAIYSEYYNVGQSVRLVKDMK